MALCSICGGDALSAPDDTAAMVDGARTDGGAIAVAVVSGIVAIGFPGLIIAAKYRLKHWCTKFIDPLIACYAFGIAWGNVFAAAKLNGEGTPMFEGMDLLSQGTVAFALPMLMFGTDLRSIRGAALWCLVAMVLGAVAFTGSTILVHYLFQGSSIEASSHIIAALITAVCVGGTPNMAAVRVALGVDAGTFIAVHTSETVVGAVYVLFMMTCWRRLLRPCFRDYDGGKAPCLCLRAEEEDEELQAGGSIAAGGEVELSSSSSQASAGRLSPGPKGPKSDGAPDHVPSGSLDAESQLPAAGAGAALAESADPPAEQGSNRDGSSDGSPAAAPHSPEDGAGGGVPAGGEQAGAGEEDKADISKMSEGVDAFADMLHPKYRRGLLLALLVDLVVVGVGAGLGLLAGPWSTLVTILLITALSLALSLVPWLRDTPHTFTVGEYIVLAFCTVVGMMADLGVLASTDPLVFASVAAMMGLGVAVHHLLAAAAFIDGDTFIVSSAANLLSPPFVGVACKAVGNKALIAPGVTAGLVGYAIGNFLGIAVGTLLVPASA
ncbi:hypothetical protein FNF27_00977 [Cafeteria roenbergensis]|uniref:Uncharacterized protein n=2 Tax=Cafeteria roenbergensis TaxID=33653 RepID=A0A5A8EIS7_CAFRO|nr:hypothetical protein FNF27_00977 [Cafeteria roenbergensis]